MMFETLTVAKAWELINTKFSLIGVVCFLIVCLAVLKLVKKSINIINFIGSLPPPLLAGMVGVVAAGGFGYGASDCFAKTPTFTTQIDCFMMCASFALALVALKHEKK